MQDVFQFRDSIIQEYAQFSRSFSTIAAEDIREYVDSEYERGRYWPEPLIQINPSYKKASSVQDLVDEGIIHPACAHIFKTGKPDGRPRDLILYKHQMDALAIAKKNEPYVVTTGTGSGKSIAFFLPIVDRILREREAGGERRTRAIVIYPMNALANSQLDELGKFLHGYPDGERPFSAARYTGQESQEERKAIAENPPDILLTNFMMLELLLTRYEETDRQVIDHCRGLKFLVLDELHTYRGRQGADVALLVRRVRQRLQAAEMLCIGTSATMSNTGSLQDQQATVARVSSLLFGQTVSTANVISETLDQVTDSTQSRQTTLRLLPDRLKETSFRWSDIEDFKRDPLAIWVETTLGIEMNGVSSPIRAKPLGMTQAAQLLARDTGSEPEVAYAALQRFLMAAHAIEDGEGRKPLAFKLHQYISGPGKVLMTLEAPGERFITMTAQRFAPGRDEVFLYPAYFCRECGQEYHPVELTDNRWGPREIDAQFPNDAEDRFGFLVPCGSGFDYDGNVESLPDFWMEQRASGPRVKKEYSRFVPTKAYLDAHGQGAAYAKGEGQEFWYIPGHIRFCPRCGMVHEPMGKDINRLSSLSGEGRSSATTMITMSVLRQLFAEEPGADDRDQRKILGFTDNRQDAALQSGHFNDFVFLVTLRGGIVGALQRKGGVLTEDAMPEEVFQAIGFGRNDYAAKCEYLNNPDLFGLNLAEAQRALKFVLGYRIIRDFRKGWRFNNPSLDQLGLVDIAYVGMDEYSRTEGYFEHAHSAIKSLDPERRKELFALVFAEMRKNLCVDSRFLDPGEQERMKTKAWASLKERWGFAFDEKLTVTRYMVLSPLPERLHRSRLDYISGGVRSRLVRIIKRAPLWNGSPLEGQILGWKDAAVTEIVQSALELARDYGFVKEVPLDRDFSGWCLKSQALEWHLRESSEPRRRASHNEFFRQVYRGAAATLSLPTHYLFEYESHEHTAQVENSDRMILEARFRFTHKDKAWWKAERYPGELERLPVLFCSPTMELGVDISSLNTVYMRNVPPTPANYAQRSGRAGRSGQPALVITYCAAQSPHDQWFFTNAPDMVHGIVKAPTLDLSNRDLVDSHLDAIWLSCLAVKIESSISLLLELDLAGYPIAQELMSELRNPAASALALEQAKAIAVELRQTLSGDGEWLSDTHIEAIVAQAPANFDKAFERWRGLYAATLRQMELADAIVRGHATRPMDRDSATRRYTDAKRQLDVLLSSQATQNSDFYTYRYLAGQGFLPGYNFPRLPLMAWIPARGSRSSGERDSGSMVSRPRFLGISEFGPRSLIYHDGRMYQVKKAKLSSGSMIGSGEGNLLPTIHALVCPACGHGHFGSVDEPEVVLPRCENCGAELTGNSRIADLFRIETVETEAVERISVNDEERQRQGYDIQTMFRLNRDEAGHAEMTRSIIRLDGETIGDLVYSPAALLWRINRGWKRRKNKNILGFYIDPISGWWRAEEDDENKSEGDVEAARTRVPPQRIVPFVEDYRNILILALRGTPSKEAMATLQASLKRGIEQIYQIEESELAVEPLPLESDRKQILFYEASEGGAGVLTRLARDPDELAAVARMALRILHYRVPERIDSVDDLVDLQGKDARDPCVAACYQCLLSYYNQPEHKILDRRNAEALGVLVALSKGDVSVQGTMDGGAVDVTTGFDDGAFSAFLKRKGFRMPDAFMYAFMEGKYRADALYRSDKIAVFFKAPPDESLTYLRDRGFVVSVIGENEDAWDRALSQDPQAIPGGKGKEQ
ncbi:MAG TPA: DEAD/DEAH box helicase [Rectinemataceae bacterium]|nr:DEAD/DEAH box helicase [Rectinemataceae bacterium]